VDTAVDCAEDVELAVELVKLELVKGKLSDAEISDVERVDVELDKVELNEDGKDPHAPGSENSAIHPAPQ
jgi:hypothetical protein